MPTSESTRRWHRLPVDMPVRVVTSKGFSTTVVEGRGTETERRRHGALRRNPAESRATCWKLSSIRPLPRG